MIRKAKRYQKSFYRSIKCLILILVVIFSFMRWRYGLEHKTDVRIARLKPWTSRAQGTGFGWIGDKQRTSETSVSLLNFALYLSSHEDMVLMFNYILDEIQFKIPLLNKNIISFPWRTGVEDLKKSRMKDGKKENLALLIWRVKLKSLFR